MERIGVHKVGLILSEMGLIFRETSNTDTGVDGQIEEVDANNNATGRIMAVQIKSGGSYLYDNGACWKIYVDEGHKNYWRLFPIPVMLLVYNPSDRNVYFIDIKYALNTIGKIEIPKTNILCEDNKEEFLKTIGGSFGQCSEIDEIFHYMIHKKCIDKTFPVSFIELFVSGLTNLCHDLFYDVSLAMNIADVKSSELGISVNHDFLWEYVIYLVKENLAEINFHACMYDYDVRKMQPRFIAPLTYRGRQLLDYISNLEAQCLGEADVSIVCESLIDLQFDHNSIQRLNKLTELQSLLCRRWSKKI